jgi:ABC-type bacteriocin/lantibiotic exporter with double-glycine peptidase domain
MAAAMELAGISLLLHTVLSILKPDFIQHNILTSFIYHTLGIQGSRQFILVIAIGLFVLYVIKNILLVQLNKIQVRFAFSITSDVSGVHYRRISKKELGYFTSRKSADVINELTATTISFPENILLSSIMLLTELMVIILVLGAILFYKPFLFLFTFLTIFPAAGVLVYINRKRLRNQGLELHKINPRLFENIAELTTGIANVKLWNGTNYFFDRYSKLKSDAYRLKENIYISSHYVPIRIYEVIAISGILCVVLYGIMGQHSTSSIISYLSIYAGVSFRLLPSVNRIISTSNTLSTNEYLLDYLNFKASEVNSHSDYIKPIKFSKSIGLKEASFSYMPEETVVNNVNLEIFKGRFVGIVGPSGSGKSTLVNMLASLIEPTQGNLLLDGKVLVKEDYASYRFLFSYVKQDVFMLNDSILSNVAFLDENPDLDKAKRCLEQVNLSPWLTSLSHGWHTSVGEIGNQISGGQRQRIAIARALYKDAEIFIFDEVSNNLDTYSKDQTFKAISKLKDAGKTAIFITHKEDELDLCDVVYSVQDKKVRLYEKA